MPEEGWLVTTRAAMAAERNTDDLRLVVATLADLMGELPDDLVDVMGWRDEIDASMLAYGEDVDSIKAFGLDVVTDLCERLRAAGVPALHFYTMNQSATVLEICRRLGG